MMRLFQADLVLLFSGLFIQAQKIGFLNEAYFK